MALTIGEASAVNTLIRWVLNERDAVGDPIDPSDAGNAACILARSAHKTLMAGLDEDTVKFHWKQRRETTLRRRKAR